MINIIRQLAKKEIEFCSNEEELRKIDKFYKKYFAEMNKWIAGKRKEMPYCSDDGKTVI